MNTQKSVTTIVENINGETIQIRQCSEPSEQAKEICSRLKYNPIPLVRKKSVWHTGEIRKIEKTVNQLVMDGLLQCGLNKCRNLPLEPNTI